MPKLIICALLSLLATAASAADPSPLTIEQTDEGFLFEQGGAHILFYQRQAKSFEGRYTRANYVHPLYDLDGRVLTEDFPSDHRHHRGIFWTWHQVRVGDKKIGDPWVCRDFSWDVKQADILSADEHSAALKVLVHWKSPLYTDDDGAQTPLVEEITTIRAHRADEISRQIDFEIRLLALVEDLRLGGSEDAKGYGGFSTRIRLPEGLKFMGESGRLTPQTRSVEPSRWLDMTAQFNDDQPISGLAVLCHPSLPGFPQRWILRQQRSMQNPVFPFPGREAVSLSTGDPVILRYRLVVHRGDTRAARIAELQKEYEAEE